MSSPMSGWRTILLTVIVAYGALIIGGLVFIYSGAYNVAATDRHWPLTHRLFETARVQSIKARAAEISPPAGLDDQAKIVGGTNHFAAHCAVCHGGPGVPKGDIAHGLYPEPPDLADTVKRYTDAEIFWIIKNGIKMTGMPAWADHGDNEIWGTVAFIKKLPGMTPDEYGKLVMQAMQHGGHGHGGTDQSQPHRNDGAAPAQHPHQGDQAPRFRR